MLRRILSQKLKSIYLYNRNDKISKDIEKTKQDIKILLDSDKGVSSRLLEEKYNLMENINSLGADVILVYF
jgi:hypothetical protein